MRFLLAADLHLDSPLRGLDRYDGAPVDNVRGAIRRGFENLVVTAIEERVDLVVIVGVLYDGDWPDHNTGLFFVKGVTQLAEAGDVPPILSSPVIWSPIPEQKEIGHEKAFFRRADHWLPA